MDVRKYIALFAFACCLLAMGNSRAAEQDPSRHGELAQQHVAEFTETWEARPVDDRYGIERILSCLNLDFAGLEKVRAAAEAGDLAAAEQELLRFYKNAWADQAKPLDKMSDKVKLHAADAMRHHFRGNGDVYPPVWRGAEIDWTGRAFVDGEEIEDAEWYFQFQRLTWWPALARAYSVTGDEDYFFEWRYEMVNWAEINLPLNRQTPYFIRRGMETYGRCDRLTDVFPYFLRSEHFDSKTLLIFLGSFHEQAEHIRTVYSRKGNHLLGELSQVFVNGILFPEFRKSDEWIGDALERLPEMMFSDIYPDGMNKELVFSYHTMYIGLFVKAYNLFREHGYEDRIPPEYYDRLLKMAEIYAIQSFPDNTVCQFGDAWKYGDVTYIYRRPLAPFKDDIPYYDYMVSGGREGEPPPRLNAAYPVSGFYFFRSEWSPDAVFMPIKCAVGDVWHSQIDNGTFELFAYGRNFMNDSGCYVYNSDDEETQAWRRWFRSTRVHQTLTLDNRDIDLKPRHVLWNEADDHVALVFENQSYTNLLHRRTVLFVDNRYFLIHDEAEGDAAGDVRIHFQLVPCEVKGRGMAVQTQFPSGPNLLVKTFPQNQVVKIKKEEGWISYKQKEKETRPAWSFGVRKSGGTKEVSFLTALVPYREGEAPESVKAAFEEKDGTRRYVLLVDGQEYKVELDAAH